MATQHRPRMPSLAEPATAASGPAPEVVPMTVTVAADGLKLTTVVVTNQKGETEKLTYTQSRLIGNGSFGVVTHVLRHPSGEPAAIKKMFQDRRYKNRELTLLRQLHHDNIVALQAFFYSSGARPDEIYLNLVLEYIPETVLQTLHVYAQNKQFMPLKQVQTILRQVCRGLAYLHAMNICHRDLKPANLLFQPDTDVVKICDFGSAKKLVPGETSVAYICTIYYRAPELIFGATQYTTTSDLWSVGCILAELLLGQPLFCGENSVDQLVEIIRVVGTPTQADILAMNPHYTDFKLPRLQPVAWSKVMRTNTPTNALDVLAGLMVYTPTQRWSAERVLRHTFLTTP